jgi:hypothetical protein
MRKLLLSSFVLATGCTAASQPGGGSATRPEAVGTTSQAVTLTTTGDDDGANKLRPLHWVTPNRGGGSSDGGTVGDGGSTVGTWQPLTNTAQFYAGTALLLTDGTVILPDVGSTNWWKLTPDARGNYVDGTWTQIASPPNAYQPLYFASAILPDGRVIIEGGEYQALNPVWQTTGAIYDPTKDQWTSVAPPAQWQTIGDAQSVVLADGRFMLADCCSTNAAILDPKTLTWTPIGTGKADINDEEGWTLLPNGDLLTVDTNDLTDLTNTEIFSPRTGAWTSAGQTPAVLPDQNAEGTGSWEMGPQVLRPNGTVWAVGATGHSAVYHTQSGRWTPGPDFPNVAGQGQLGTADGAGVLLPNGHVLVTASPGVFQVPLHMFDFDGRNITEITPPPDAPNDSSFNASMLVLPNGQILFTDLFSNDVEIYTPSGEADCSWKPQIDDACGLDELQPGSTYALSGTQLHGLSQGSAYGDDMQQSTNYPLVRITNRATGDVTYARTHDFSSMSVAPGAWSKTHFDVPAGIETGVSLLQVVVNGIASDPIPVHVRGRQAVNGGENQL